MSDTNTTARPLTTAQADALNKLAETCANLVKAAKDLAKRSAEIAEHAEKGYHLPGFESDVLGQPGREVQHHASVRSALIYALPAGTPKAAIRKAMTNTALFVMDFAEGDAFGDDAEEA